jgi:hypothetical protein
MKSREQILEELLTKLVDASYSVACESNGLSDNEWTPKDGVTMIAEYPVRTYLKSLQKLSDAREQADDFLNPEKALDQQRWRDACATASVIVAMFKESQQTDESPNLCESHLHRNIADAIVGHLKTTFEEREAGIRPTTMEDKLNQLVAEGKLHNLEPKS